MKVGLISGPCRACSEQFRVLAKQEMIGHSGDVVAHDSILGVALSELGVGFGHSAGMLDVVGEELGEGYY